MPIVTEQATVYRGGHRRYFTKAAAVKGYAKAKFRAKHPCECEQSDYASGYGGYNCGAHDAWDRVGPRYIRWLKRQMQTPKQIVSVALPSRADADEAPR